MLNPWIDVSWPIDAESTPLWPGARKIELTRAKSILRGDSVNDSDLSFNLHTGTHIDAPLHFSRDGKPIGELSIEKMLGMAAVYDFSELDEITESDLARKFNQYPASRVLMKTKNSLDLGVIFNLGFVGLTLSAAQWLVERKIELIGNDYLSVQPYGGDDRIHHALLECETVILEGLRLANVTEGYYELICLPISIKNSEAAPARVLLKAVK